VINGSTLESYEKNSNILYAKASMKDPEIKIQINFIK